MCDSSEALRDATVLIRLMEGLSGQSSLFSADIEASLAQLYLQLVWEGLASRRWSSSELTTIEEQLESLDLLAEYEQGLRAEESGHIAYMETTPRARLAAELARSAAPHAAGQPPPFWSLPLECALRWGPRGWIRQIQVVYAEANQEQIDMIDTAAQRLHWTDPTRRSRSWNHSVDGWASFGTWFGKSTLNRSYAGWYAGQAQTDVNLARMACALERYRQAHGQYPDFLSKLVPSFIEQPPHDLTTGASLHYRTTTDGQFVLYSAGLDARDDAAAGDDWVWRYPAR